MTKIFYFTGTGNSLYVAQKLSNEIAAGELMKISKFLPSNKLTLDAECIGLVFPLYAFGIPEIIENFLSKLNLTNPNVYFFCVITCGGSGQGIVQRQLQSILSAKNFKLNYITFQHMPSNYIKLFRAPTDSQAKHDIEKQQAQIKLIASDIKNKVQKQLPDSLLSIFYNFIYKNWRRNLVNCSKSFYVQKTCTSCGLCVKLCPEQIIKLVNNTPTWNGKCQDCLACINLCPTKAIQSNFLTKIYGRYKNPFIKVENLVK